MASGDPYDTSVLLWTRAVPTPVVLNPSAAGPNIIPDQSIPVCLSYEVFSNAQLEGRPVSSGQAFTSYDVDFTVKVEATGLKPDTQYWYVFKDCTNADTVSPVGRTRTFASPNSMLFYANEKAYSHRTTAPANEVNGGKPLTFAVFSCSRFQDGKYLNPLSVSCK